MYTDIHRVLKLKHYKSSIQYTYYLKDFNNLRIKRKKLYDKKESNRTSLARTSSLLKEYILNNDFDYFFTLTLKYDFRNDILYSVNYINKKIKLYQKQCKYRGIDFEYVYVYEKTKNGGLHLHGMIRGFYDLYTNRYNHFASYFFDEIGFQNIVPINKINPFYLIKYIEKEPIKELKHKFYRSKNLKRCEVEYLHDNFKEFENLPFTFSNSFCKMVTVEK